MTWEDLDLLERLPDHAVVVPAQSPGELFNVLVLKVLPDSLQKSVGDPPKTLERITTSHDVNWSDAA